MQKNRRKAWIGIGLLLTLLVLMPTKTVKAASVTITFSVNQEMIHAGDEFEVTVTLTSTDTMGDFEAYISYDELIVEPTSKPACITGGGGLLRVSDIGASASPYERTYRIWFTALTQGDCELAIYDRPKVYGYTDGMEMSATSMSTVVSVFPAVGASENSRLSTLRLVDGISESVLLTPIFTPETTTYFTAVPYEAERLIISALAEDSRSVVTISGEEKLAPGSNEVKITVTAENGTQTIYTIYVHRDLEPTATPSATPDNPNGNPPITGITLSAEGEAIFITEYHRYTVCERPEELKLPAGYEKTYLFLNEIQVTAYVESENPSEFLLLTLKNENGNIEWYSYDRIEQTLQRVNDRQFVIQEVIVSEEEELKQTLAEYQQKQETLLFSLAFLCGVCVLLLLVIAWLLFRSRKKKNHIGE